jgi:TnpA family transposase
MVDFYSVQIKEHVEVPEDEVEVVTMENGRKAAKAEIVRDGKTLKLFKFLSDEDARRLSGGAI